MRLALALLLACGGGSTEPTPPAPEPAAPVAPAPVAAPPPAAPVAPGGLRVLHNRVAKGRELPTHVSATWVGEGAGSALQVMITGLPRACAPEPTFSLVMAGNQVRLVEAPFEAEGDCTGSHTVMLQLDGQAARDLVLTVMRADGSEFGSTEVAADDH